MESITTPFLFLSLSLCRGLFAFSSRFISTTLHHGTPRYTRKISYQMFNNLHKLIERGYRRNKVAR